MAKKLQDASFFPRDTLCLLEPAFLQNNQQLLHICFSSNFNRSANSILYRGIQKLVKLSGDIILVSNVRAMDYSFFLN